jgi:nicotinamide phosphoribosyltransferase
MPIAATLGFEFKKNAVEWVNKTDPENLWLADYMCHDFHSRGGNPFTSIAVGLGHALSNSGSDTLNVIPASRYYYDVADDKVLINSVLASEHSVTCTGIFYYEAKLKDGKLDQEIKDYYAFDAPSEGSVENPDYLAIAELLNLRDWLLKFPKGILSVVSDTMDLWKLITHILPRLKSLIMARDGKLVIRPDSGDPVEITCGIGNRTEYTKDGITTYFRDEAMTQEISINEKKGVIELLADIFGTVETSTGYKRLDSHIGAIYGDSITLERQVQIYSRLANKGFAATNIVLGIGSYTYVYMTRDTAGFAAKGAWFQVQEVKEPTGYGTYPGLETTSYNIYKDPVTDDGTKKSLKGMCAVHNDYEEPEGDTLIVKQECTEEEEAQGLLQVIYEDGKFFNQQTFEQIRAKINK